MKDSDVGEIYLQVGVERKRVGSKGNRWKINEKHHLEFKDREHFKWKGPQG